MIKPVHLRSLGLLVFAITCLGAAVFLLSRVGTDVIPQGERYVVEADVRDAIALAVAADVRQAGVKIGRVTEVREKGRVTALKLQLDPEYGPVYRNATVQVRAKSVAEENYVDLEPGDPKSGKVMSGGVLPVSRELEATQNDDVFSILDEDRRRNLQRALKGIGGGLEGEGGRDLNRTFESSVGVVEDTSDLARTLAGQRSHVARLVDSLGTVSRALGERKEAIRSFTVSSKAEAEAIAARDEDLKATLDALPQFLRQARSSADRLNRFSTSATPVLRDVRLAADDLVPAVEDLLPGARAGRRALAKLQRFSEVSQPTFERLVPFSKATSAAIGPYSESLRQLNPFVAYLEPYWRELPGWFATVGAATDFEDSVGKVARILLPISRSGFAGNLSPEVNKLLEQLSGGLDTRGSNALPAPGTVAKGTPASGDRLPPLADAPYGGS
ncbi:MAG: MCE family protein [Solirubrobacterales bacterium]|nr:MCE family protein [Solirubrobacterales bacterium]